MATSAPAPSSSMEPRKLKKRKQREDEKGGKQRVKGEEVEESSVADDVSSFTNRVASLSVPSSSSTSIDSDSVRGRPLPPATLTYFRTIQSRLEEMEGAGGVGGDAAAEELSLLVSAAWREMRGVEYRLMVNKHGSRCVELLLSHSSVDEMRHLLLAVQSTAFPLFTDRNASHPLERLLHRLPPFLSAEAKAGTSGESDSLSAALVHLCLTLSAEPPAGVMAASTFSAPPSSHWPLLLCNESSSHLLRSLVLLLTGHTDLPLTLKSSNRRSSTSLPAVPPAAPSSVSPLYDTVLSSLVASIAELKEADRIELAFHSSASPTLQILLTALASHSTYSSLLFTLISALLLSDSSSPFVLSSTGSAHLQQLCRHHIGSHLVEYILTVSSSACEEVFMKIGKSLMDDLHELALHSSANHVVQRMLAVAGPSHQKLLKKCIKRLQPHLKEYFTGGRAGVVWRLIQSSAHVKESRRQQLVDGMKAALNCSDSAQLLQSLLHLPPSMPSSSDDAPSSSTPQGTSVSYLGSVILQALLSLPNSDSSLVSAVVSLSSDELRILACDACGVHILEAVLSIHSIGSTSFSHSLSHQLALVDRLLPSVVPLALSVHGSFLLEKAYKSADIVRKRNIAAALAENERMLKHSKSGQAALRTCRISAFKSHQKTWVSEEGVKKRKAHEMFADLLNEPSAGDRGEKKKNVQKAMTTSTS